jgi:hypothetical protein
MKNDSLKQDRLNSGFQSQFDRQLTGKIETAIPNWNESLKDKSFSKIGEDLPESMPYGYEVFIPSKKKDLGQMPKESKLNQGFQSSWDKGVSEFKETYCSEEKEKISDKLISKIK